MINKLPKWVEIGGFLLALNAGFINAIALLGFKHQAVSHLTGISTYLALEIATFNWQEMLYLLLVMLSFVYGAAYGGFVVGNTALKLGRRYTIALMTESTLLFASTYFLVHNSAWGHLFASAACGLQNAMTSTYSGAIVRTTHVSGMFTDLGIIIGLKLRGQAADSRKIILYLTIITGFIVGGVAGAYSFGRFHFSAMLLPGIIAALIGIGYWLLSHWKHRHATRH